MSDGTGGGRRARHPGLAAARTRLAWHRTAISFVAVGVAILRTDRAAAAVVLAISGLVWSIGWLPTGDATRRRRAVRLTTAATTVASLVALTLVLWP